MFLATAVVIGAVLALLIVVDASTPTVVGAMLALIAIVVAIPSSLLTVAEDIRRRARFDRLLFETAYEAAHNLQHLAQTSATQLELPGTEPRQKPQVWPRWPDLITAQARRLLDDQFEDLLPGDLLWGHVDHMIRNDDYLRRAPLTIEGLAQVEHVVAFFIEYCIRVLVEIARTSERASRLATSLRCAEFTKLCQVGNSTPYAVRYQSTWWLQDLAKNPPDPAISSALVALVWLDNLAGSSLEQDERTNVESTIELGANFHDLPDPPERPPYPERPWHSRWLDV